MAQDRPNPDRLVGLRLRLPGHFVPNITIGPLVVEALRPLREETSAWLDVHLMIENADRYLADFAKAGADIITVQVEACTHLHRTVQAIKGPGVRAGVTLNPATSLTALEEILPHVDLALIMSVNPGFGGQSYTAHGHKLRFCVRAAVALRRRAAVQLPPHQAFKKRN